MLQRCPSTKDKYSDICRVCKQNICKTYCANAAKNVYESYQCNIVAEHQLVNNSENNKKILTNRHSGGFKGCGKYATKKKIFFTFPVAQSKYAKKLFFLI